MKSKEFKNEHELINYLILRKKYNILSKVYQEKIGKEKNNRYRVELAKLMLTGKIIPNNVKARELLMLAYRDGNKEAGQFYAYMLINGLGGVKKEKKGIEIIKKEIRRGNPSPMGYIELRKYYKKNKNKEEAKVFKQLCTKNEKKQYKKQLRKNKMCNNFFGKVIYFVPNKFNVLFEELLDEIRIKKLAENMNDLFYKAQKKHSKGENVTARYIYKRLSEYGDEEASILYADMCKDGCGGKKEIKKAKDIYENIIEKYSCRLERINKKIVHINDMEDYNKNIVCKDELDNLIVNRKIVINNKIYKNAMLSYGILLVDNFKQNDGMFEKGVKILNVLAKNGDQYLGTKREYLNEISRSAMIKLGNLLEEGHWKPANAEEIKKIFVEFETGKEIKYATRILDFLNKKDNKKDKKIDKNVEKQEKIKFYRLKKSSADFCYALGSKYPNKYARKIYSEFSRKGNYCCDDNLANLEYNGFGGTQDLESAKKHFVNFLDYTKNANDEEFLKYRAGVMCNYADLLMELNEVEMAIPLYKTACLYGIKDAKYSLNDLMAEGKWSPINNREKELIRVRTISGFVSDLSKQFHRKTGKNTVNSDISKKEFYKSVAAVMATVMLGKNVSKKYENVSVSVKENSEDDYEK